MFKKICIELNAANPQIPFETSCPYTGSAASFTILNAPRPLGKRTVDKLYLEVTSVDGVTRSFAATRVGSAWGVTVPADAIGAPGVVRGGVAVWCSGTDDNGEPVECWILGTGDLSVLDRDGSAHPGIVRHNVHGYAAKTSAPQDYDLAPSGDSPDSPFEMYFHGAWRQFGGGGGDVRHSDFSDMTEQENMTLKEVGTVVNTLIRKLKGTTALLLLSACCLSSFADVPLSPDTDFGDVHPTQKLGVVIHAAVDGAARPLPKYLHALDFDDSYPDAAAEYYRSRGDGRTDGGCSAVRSGGYLYRNFDYPFDDRAEFVVKMSAGAGRFASVGVAQVGTNLTEAIVTSGKPNRCYKWLPGATVDGINENGVVCEINVVDSPVAGWHATGGIHPLGAIRWILDHATNAQHGAEYIAENIRFPAGWTQNFHYMVADAEKTYIVENGTAYDAYDAYFAPGEEPAVMTNFRLSAFWWGGMGLERFNLLMGGVSITNAWYTRAYRRETNPPWVSDLAEVIAYTNDIFDAWAAHDKEHFRGKTNNGIPWWQTVHTSIYDITNRTLRIAVQEVDDWYVFAVPSAGGVKPDAVKEIVEPMIAAHHDETKLDTYGKFYWVGGVGVYLQFLATFNPNYLQVGSWSEIALKSGYPLSEELDGKQSKITASGLLKGDGDGNVTAATPEDIPTSQYLRVYDSVRHCWMRGYMVNGVMQWEVE